MTCFWWQLTCDITTHIIRLSLKEGCFEINMEKITQLFRNPGLVDAGESVCRCSLCLSWKPRSTHQAFALRKLPFCVGLDGKYPSSCHIILRFELPHIHLVKKPHCQSRISNRGVSLQRTACCIFVLPGLKLLFVRGISSWLLLLRLFHWWPYSVPAYSVWEFSVVTKQNDPAAAAYLCASGVIVQYSSLVRTLRSGWSIVLPES